MAVRSNNDTMLANCVIDEFGVLSSKAVQALLDNVVAIQVLHQFYNTFGQGIDDRLNLLWGVDKFDHLLQGASAVLIQGNRNETRGCGVDEGGALIFGAVFKQLLAEIVSERICCWSVCRGYVGA
jgi:hypothetical protein